MTEVATDGVRAANLTDRERKFLHLVATGIDQLGIQPSYRDAAVEMGYSSVNSVASIVRALTKKGIVKPTTRGVVFEWRQFL